MSEILSRLLLADLAPPSLPSTLLENKPLLIGLGAGVGLFFLAVVIWFGRGRKKVDPEVSLSENLRDYPPAPADGKRRVLVQGQPGRLRLVVVAPIGKKPIEVSEVEGLLNAMVRGLGDLVRQDKPRIRIWPAQLSKQGFAPTFHRRIHRPEPLGQASPWVLLAGSAQAEGQQILVGLAVCADRANKLDQMTLQGGEWGEVIRMQ